MTSNLDRYKKDIDALIVKGHNLYVAMVLACSSTEQQKKLKEGKDGSFYKGLPDFNDTYQTWYSEAGCPAL